MNSGRITRFSGELSRITRFAEVALVKPEPVYAGWSNFASQRSIRCIAVGRRSLWLATRGGVLAWERIGEGVCRRYASEHGLASNAVACVILDEAGRPWAGHDEGGVSYFDGQRWQVADAPDEPVRALATALGGGVWMATNRAVYFIPSPGSPRVLVAEDHDGAVGARALLSEAAGVLLGNAWGLFRLMPGQAPERLEANTLRSCVGLTRDGRGCAWAAAPDGVYRLRADSSAVMPNLLALSSTEGVPTGLVLGLAAGQERVWVWTSAGLACVEGDRWLSLPAPTGNEGRSVPLAVRTLASSSDEFLWVGTDGGLVLAWRQGGETLWGLDVLPEHPEDRLNNLAHCVTSLPGRGAWVGTAGGLITFGPEGGWSLDAEVGDVRGLCLARDEAGEETLFLLAWPRGLARRDKAGRVRFLLQPPDGVALTLASSWEGTLHVLTTRALWRVGPGEPVAVGDGADEYPCCLAQTADGRWWLGTNRGVFRLSPTGHWDLAGEQPGPLASEVTGLSVAGDVLWAATSTGLWAKEGTGWQLYPVCPLRSAVWAVAPAGGPRLAGTLWVAREDGLARYNPVTRTVEECCSPAGSGLASVRVTGLAADGDRIWVATRVGVSRLVVERWATQP